MQRWTRSEVVRALREQAQDFVRVLERSEFDVGLYKPDAVDAQTPHARDELYVIASGTGWFVLAGERSPFAPGDALFVPAGAVHRFEDFSEDFAAWVVFFGPRPASRA